VLLYFITPILGSHGPSKSPEAGKGTGTHEMDRPTCHPALLPQQRAWGGAAFAHRLNFVASYTDLLLPLRTDPQLTLLTTRGNALVVAPCLRVQAALCLNVQSSFSFTGEGSE